MDEMIFQLVYKLYESMKEECPKTHAGLTEIILDAGIETSELVMRYFHRVEELAKENGELHPIDIPVIPLVAYVAVLEAAQSCFRGGVDGIGAGMMEFLAGLTPETTKTAVEQRAAEQLAKDKEIGKA